MEHLLKIKKEATENVNVSRCRKKTKQEALEMIDALIPDDLSHDNDSFGVLSHRSWHFDGTLYFGDFVDEARDITFWGRVYSPASLNLLEEAMTMAIEQ